MENTVKEIKQTLITDCDLCRNWRKWCMIPKTSKLLPPPLFYVQHFIFDKTTAGLPFKDRMLMMLANES